MSQSVGDTQDIRLTHKASPPIHVYIITLGILIMQTIIDIIYY